MFKKKQIAALEKKIAYLENLINDIQMKERANEKTNHQILLSIDALKYITSELGYEIVENIEEVEKFVDEKKIHYISHVDSSSFPFLLSSLHTYVVEKRKK